MGKFILVIQVEQGITYDSRAEGLMKVRDEGEMEAWSIAIDLYKCRGIQFIVVVPVSHFIMINVYRNKLQDFTGKPTDWNFYQQKKSPQQGPIGCPCISKNYFLPMKKIVH